MDAKYVGRHVALSRDASDTLDRARVLVTREIGFELSYSQTIHYLATKFIEQKESERNV